MTSPSNPEQKGSKGVVFDGMSAECHKEQFEHANKGSDRAADRTTETDEEVSDNRKDN